MINFYSSFRQIILVSIFSIHFICYGQPNWKVNPADFEYTVALTGVALIPCAETMDSGDMVAAFVGEQVRGVQFFDGLSGGRNYCYMIIYDSIFSGSKVSFKLYDASEDTIYNALQMITFVENGTVGNVHDPFIFEVENKLENITIEGDSISIHAKPGSEYSRIYVQNLNSDTIDAAFEMVNDSLGIDNNLFEIIENKLILALDISKLSKNALQIHIRGISKNKCSIDKVLTIPLKGQIVDSKIINTDNVVVYPNPAYDHLNIISDIHYDHIQILNTNGEVIKTIPYKKDLNISLNELTPSLYIFRLIRDNRIIYNDKVIRH